MYKIKHIITRRYVDGNLFYTKMGAKERLEELRYEAWLTNSFFFYKIVKVKR